MFVSPLLLGGHGVCGESLFSAYLGFSINIVLDTIKFLAGCIGLAAAHTGYACHGFAVLSESSYVIVGEPAFRAVCGDLDGVCLHGL